MTYTVVNELERFSFHDAQIHEMKLTERSMRWTASAINAMTTNSQNSHPQDMCVETAVMTFEDAVIENLRFGAYQVYNSRTELVEAVEAREAGPDEYEEILSRSTSRYCYIYGMEKPLEMDGERYRARFDIDGGAGSYYLTVTFSASLVEWEEYSGAAWYEHPKWKKG